MTPSSFKSSFNLEKEKKNPCRLLIIVGGPTAEHEISILSGRNILNSSLKSSEVGEVFVIIISKNRKWFLLNDPAELRKINNLDSDLPRVIGIEVTLWQRRIFTVGNRETDADNSAHNAQGNSALGDSTNVVAEIDVAFPVLHGPYGENGSVQGMLEIADVPYVGEDTLRSAIIMNKCFFKNIIQQNNIPNLPFISVKREDCLNLDFHSVCQLLEKMGYPGQVKELIVKTADQGSSIGVFRVLAPEFMQEMCNAALNYGELIIIEPFVKVMQELECAVLVDEEGNMIISEIGEIRIVKGDIYSYSIKYLEEDSALLKIPADISPEIKDAAKSIAEKVCRVLNLKSMARVDMFLTQEGQLLLNELNTIPGFTNISMYPKLLEYSGIPQQEQVGKLIRRAFSSFVAKDAVSNDFEMTIELQNKTAYLES